MDRKKRCKNALAFINTSKTEKKVNNAQNIHHQSRVTDSKIPTICYDARHRRSAFGESPRRVPSSSKRRKAAVSFLRPDDKAASGFAVSGDHGTKSPEVYGFVGSVTTVVATGTGHCSCQLMPG